jgi:hypothetical protein
MQDLPLADAIMSGFLPFVYFVSFVVNSKDSLARHRLQPRGVG